jgi:hypothetical protein
MLNKSGFFILLGKMKNRFYSLGMLGWVSEVGKKSYFLST